LHRQENISLKMGKGKRYKGEKKREREGQKKFKSSARNKKRKSLNLSKTGNNGVLVRDLLIKRKDHHEGKSLHDWRGGVAKKEGKRKFQRKENEKGVKFVHYFTGGRG